MSDLVDRINGYTGGVAVKIPCLCATTGNIALSGLQVIDGIQTTEGSRVLVKDQNNVKENGIYNASSSSWTRAKDFDGNRDAVNGTFLKVVGGTVNSKTIFNLVANDPIVIGSSDIVFEIETYTSVENYVNEAITARNQAVAAAALLPLNNYTATTDPTVGDDANDGYSSGSQWVNVSTGSRFSCSNATVGAAIWTEVSADLSALGDMAYEDKVNYVLVSDVPAIKSKIQNIRSANYTLVLSDAGKHILHPSADTTNRTFTIPANAAVAYPIGTEITFVNQVGAGNITVSINSDTLYGTNGTTGNQIIPPNKKVTALKITATAWLIESITSVATKVVTASAIIDQTSPSHTLIDSTNVDNIANMGLGRTRITFDVPYANTNYNVQASALQKSGFYYLHAGVFHDGTSLIKTTDYVDIVSFYASSNFVNADYLDVVIFS